MSEIRFVDTTLRDGQQSLWALRMRTEMMLPTLDDIDAAGFDGVEFLLPSTYFVRAVKDLKEDPWDWLRLGAPRMRRTQLRLHGGAGSYFTRVPRCIQDLLLERMAHYGLSVIRTGNFWNDYRTMTGQVSHLRGFGIDSILNIIYAISPRHTIDYYVERTKQAASVGASRLCFKDVGGMLTPEVAATLLPLVVRHAGDLPVEFHGHCNNGFGPYNALLAAEAGITVIHTAIPPLANGSSQPSVFQLAANLELRGFEPAIDLAPLERVALHFGRVARRDHLPLGVPAEYDEAIYRHQVPGGMVSTLEYHLAQVGLGDRLRETLDETARVRADFGYPIMVTPLSQFVGTQAAINVMTGTRYGVVTDESIAYALGYWGEEALQVMDRAVREVILDRPRVREIEHEHLQVVEEPSLAEVRDGCTPGISDEELILRVLVASRSGDLGLAEHKPLATSYEEYWNSNRGIAGMLGRFAELNELEELRFSDSQVSLVARRGVVADRG